MMPNNSSVSGVAVSKKVQDTLSFLRKQLRDGKISRIQFQLNASEYYVHIHKPFRALALLKNIPQRLLTLSQREQFEIIKKKIASLSPLPINTCSLNMIVRNEEKAICKSLEPVDTLFDEIVICDTGSTDKTIELAQEYGVTIIREQWQNDFSSARNRAIDASSCDWILWMDADDSLDPSCIEPLRQLWQTGISQAAAFCIVNVRSGMNPFEFLQVRLFPRNPNIRFERRIHEQIMYSIAREKIPFARHPEIKIFHTGYLHQDTHTKKILRNLPLIIKELKVHKNDHALQLTLADSLSIVGELQKAREEYWRIIKNSRIFSLNSDIYTQAHIQCARLYMQAKDYATAKKLFQKSILLDNTRIESYYFLGKMYLEQGDDNKAAEYFMKSAHINPPIRMTAADNLQVKLNAIYYLASILISWNSCTFAEQLLSSSVQLYPMVPQFYSLLGKAVLSQKRLKEAAEYFTKSIALAPEKNILAYEGMAEIYAACGDKETARSYLQKAS